MPKAETLLPPALETDEGARSLDGVGVQAVLGAMIEQRRASQVSALELEALDLDGAEDPDAESEELPEDLALTPASGKKRTPASSDVFLKAR